MFPTPNTFPQLCFFTAERQKIEIHVVGFTVNDKGIATPVLYPVPPKNTPVYEWESGSFREINLSTGLPVGSFLNASELFKGA